jgi:DNA invertase Pin-like site-specific DNA recombinase
VGARAVIYTRPERNKKGEMVDDNAQQAERCEQYAREHGYRVNLILQEDEFGPEDERPELKQLRAAIWKRQIDILITPKPETIYRDTNRLVRLTKELSMVDARIEFVDVDIDAYANMPDSDGRF